MRWMMAVSVVLLVCVSWACDKSSSKSSSPADRPPDMQQPVAPTTAPVAAPTSAPATQASAGKPINQFCAVEHDNKIDPKVTTVYNGRVIGFCCPDCIPDFKKDPSKYMASLK
jgi:YHS domain-containing protein